MKYIVPILAGYLLFLTSACEKEQEPVPPTVEKPKVVLKTDRFFVKDTTNGKAEAIKNDSIRWIAGVTCNKNKNSETGFTFYSILCKTYASDRLSLREFFALDGIPENCEGKTFVCKVKAQKESEISTLYARLYSDGDVVNDWYNLDTTVTTNFLTIHKLDRTNRRIEGSFSAKMGLAPPRFDPLNPYSLHLTSGKFWANWQE